MKEKILNKINIWFDFLYKKIESVKCFKFISIFLAIVFVFLLILIFINNTIELPPYISKHISSNYFFSVEIVFILLLIIEISEMIFVLAHSVSNSVSKQFEIFSLILLRHGLNEFSYLKFPIKLPIELPNALTTIMHLLSDTFGALIIFGGILVFSKMQKHKKITMTPQDNYNFISAKKGLALIILITFISIGIFDIVLYFSGNKTFDFFSIFYTILIFTDILIVIIQLRYNHLYCVVFRNTSFAIGTILIRFALELPHYYNAGVGIIAIFFVILVSFIYNKFVIYRRL